MSEQKLCPMTFNLDKTHSYHDCVQGRCEWWVDEHKESWESQTGEMRTGLIAGHCSVHDLAMGRWGRML
jgi:hypothetical protein